MKIGGRFYKVLFIAAAAFLFLSVMNMQSSVQAARNDLPIKSMDAFIDAYSKIKANYVDDVSDEELMHNAIKGMIQELDAHSTLYTQAEYKEFVNDMKGEFGGLGLQVGMRDKLIIVIAPIDGTPGYRQGIKSGDIIYKIDDKSTAGMSVDDAVKIMRGKPGTKISLTLLREGESEPLVFNIVREVIKVKATSYRVIDKEIGYIRLGSFKIGAADEIKEAMKALDKESVKGYIFDLRSNPGGSLEEAEKIVSLFLPAGEIVVTTKDRYRESSAKTASFGFRDLKKPLVVLIDEGSASASEIVAGAIQDHKRGLIVGKTTFGKASVQRLIELSDGSNMKLTIARYYTPLGRSIQGVGIVPDIEVSRGKIIYDNKPSYIVKEKDLAKHLPGENESGVDEESVSERFESDLQLQSAVQLLKGLIFNVAY